MTKSPTDATLKPDDCDLIPNVLAGVESIDMSTTLMGHKMAMPLFLSPTALQRLFHHDGERAVAAAADKHETYFGISSQEQSASKRLASTIQRLKCFSFMFTRIKV